MSEQSNATNDTSPEPKSFDRCGPFVIDYKRCYSGFGTAVKHNGVEYIVVCHDHSKLEEIVTETLSARIEAGFFRVIVAPESKAKPLVAEAASIPSATEQKWPHGYGLKVSDNCLWLIWPEGMINLTHLVGTESIPSRRDIAKATRMAL